LTNRSVQCMTTRFSGPALNEQQKEFIMEMWRLDLIVNTLTASERMQMKSWQKDIERHLPETMAHAFRDVLAKFKSSPISGDAWESELIHMNSLRDRLEDLKAIALKGFPGMKKVDKDLALPEKDPSFQGTLEDWTLQLLSDEPFDYDKQRRLCQDRSMAEFNKIYGRIQEELSRPCQGTTTRLGSNCSVLPAGCPEGTSCGTASTQSLHKSGAVLGSVYGLILAMTIMMGRPELWLVCPGQTELAIAAAAFFANEGHQCACTPEPCKWSENWQMCVPKGAAKADDTLALRQSFAFAGYKCVATSPAKRPWLNSLGIEEPPSCSLAQCSEEDYSGDLVGEGINPINPDILHQLHGKLGKIGQDNFNCWALEKEGQRLLNSHMPSAKRSDIYSSLSLIESEHTVSQEK